AALEFAAQIEARHEVVETAEVQRPEYAANPANRCDYCKSELYGRLRELARERGFEWIVDGYSRDDDGDWRPGRAAAREYGVRSPLHEAGFGKNDVRELARRLDLSVWGKTPLGFFSPRFSLRSPPT